MAEPRTDLSADPVADAGHRPTGRPWRVHTTQPVRGGWLQLGSIRSVDWTRHQMSSPDLPAALDGLRVVHLTDLHAHRRWMPAWDTVLKRLRDDPPDLILLTGDYVDDKFDHRPAVRLAERFLDGLTARLGVYAILGNHDSDWLPLNLTCGRVRLLDGERVRFTSGSGGPTTPGPTHDELSMEPRHDFGPDVDRSSVDRSSVNRPNVDRPGVHRPDVPPPSDHGPNGDGPGGDRAWEEGPNVDQPVDRRPGDPGDRRPRDHGWPTEGPGGDRRTPDGTPADAPNDRGPGVGGRSVDRPGVDVSPDRGPGVGERDVNRLHADRPGDLAPGVEIIGLPGVHRDDVTPALIANFPPRRPNDVRLVMAHYPDSIHALAPLAADVILTGHTHGGQVCLPGGFPLLTHDALPRRMARGLHRVGDSWLVVNRGLGFSTHAIRTFCPAEVVEIELVKAEG